MKLNFYDVYTYLQQHVLQLTFVTSFSSLPTSEKMNVGKFSPLLILPFSALFLFLSARSLTHSLCSVDASKLSLSTRREVMDVVEWNYEKCHLVMVAARCFLKLVETLLSLRYGGRWGGGEQKKVRALAVHFCCSCVHSKGVNGILE